MANMDSTQKLIYETSDFDEMRLIFKSPDMAAFISEYASYLRQMQKYGEFSEDKSDFLEEIRDKFFELLQESDLSLDYL